MSYSIYFFNYVLVCISLSMFCQSLVLHFELHLIFLSQRCNLIKVFFDWFPCLTFHHCFQHFPLWVNLRSVFLTAQREIMSKRFQLHKPMKKPDNVWMQISSPWRVQYDELLQRIYTPEETDSRLWEHDVDFSEVSANGQSHLYSTQTAHYTGALQLTLSLFHDLFSTFNAISTHLWNTVGSALDVMI